MNARLCFGVCVLQCGFANMAADPDTSSAQAPNFPSHNAPRVWFLSSADSPIGVALARRVLDHGDYVVAGLPVIDHEEREERSLEFRMLLKEIRQEDGTKNKLRPVAYDISSVGQCQAAVAEALGAFGSLDIVCCCTNETLVGTIEELSQSPSAHTKTRNQFETNFFGPVNITKAALPIMRAKRLGHIIIITGTSGHLGTPGLGMYCASQWALEGYCDSLAYEVAPFNIKVSIVQPNMEISILTNKISSVATMSEYSPNAHPAPLFREVLGRWMRALEALDSTKLFCPDSASFFPALPNTFEASLIAETVHVLTAIGGHDNPPARLIVGSEAIATVKEKLLTVSEELEDFVETSNAVDLTREPAPPGSSETDESDQG